MQESDFQRVSEEELTDPDSRTLLLKPDAPQTYTAYLVLKDWFGPPDEEDYETKIQWQYYIKAGEILLEIYDWKSTSWHLAVYHPDNDVTVAQEVAAKFLDILYKQAPRYAERVRSASLTATELVLLNPFAAYFSGAEALMDALDNAVENRILGIREHLIPSAFFLLVASFEGFLNLLYELYLKPSLRDERVYQRLGREQVDLKLRLSPIYCVCFKYELIGYASDEFQRLQYIVGLRNEFIHANLTGPMKVPVALEDGYNFLLQSESVGKYSLPRDIGLFDVQHLKFVRQTVEDVVAAILDSMEPRYKRELLSVLRERAFTVQLADGEYIIIA